MAIYDGRSAAQALKNYMNAIKETNFKLAKQTAFYRGKVRDVYTIADTYLAMVASILVTYVILWALKRTIDPLIFIYAILAGGVAIGASVDLANPWQSWVIGLIGGAASTFSFLFLDGWLRGKAGVWDTMGVHNLHGIPGIVGGLAPIVLGVAGGSQAMAVLGTIVIAVVLGLIVGLILRIMPKPTKMLDDVEAFPAEEMRATDPA